MIWWVMIISIFFGRDSETVIDHYEKADYVSKDCYERRAPLSKRAVDFIIGKQAMKSGHKENLERLYKGASE